MINKGSYGVLFFMTCVVKLYVAGKVDEEICKGRDYSIARTIALARKNGAKVIGVNAKL